jgi:hypothetical protein
MRSEHNCSGASVHAAAQQSLRFCLLCIAERAAYINGGNTWPVRKPPK